MQRRGASRQAGRLVVWQTHPVVTHKQPTLESVWVGGAGARACAGLACRMRVDAEGGLGHPQAADSRICLGRGGRASPPLRHPKSSLEALNGRASVGSATTTSRLAGQDNQSSAPGSRVVPAQGGTAGPLAMPARHCPGTLAAAGPWAALRALWHPRQPARAACRALPASPPPAGAQTRGGPCSTASRGG